MKRQSAIAARLLPDGYVLLYSNDDNNVYTLTPLGGLIWEYCDGENTIDDIVVELKKLEGLGPVESLEEEVLKLIEDLRKEGLLQED